MRMLEIHILKTYGPTQLNRNDLGEQKTITIGGVPRYRNSGYCMKRALRENFDLINDITRTRRAPKLIAELLEKRIPYLSDAEKKDMFMEVVSVLLSDKKGDNKNSEAITKQSAVYSNADLNSIAKILFDYLDTEDKLENLHNEITKNKDDSSDIEKDIQKLLKEDAKNRALAVNTALFGRMSTAGICREAEGAAYVNSAYGINPFCNEDEFFIAMEDIMDAAENGHEDWGAGMMGNHDINSATLYFYSGIDIDQLYRNLKIGREDEDISGLIAKTLAGYIRAVITASPSARQHSCASFPAPHVVYVTITDTETTAGNPMTMDSIFAEPVYKNVAYEGAKRMADFAKDNPFDMREYVSRQVVLDVDKNKNAKIDFGNDVIRHDNAKNLIASIEEIVNSMEF